MTTQLINLPLREISNYFFTVSLEGIAYEIWLYYNERMQQWIINLSDIQGNKIVMGEALVPEYPLFLDYITPDLSGCFFLIPIGESQNETISNPFEINKYYRLYYVWDDGEEEEE